MSTTDPSVAVTAYAAAAAASAAKVDLFLDPFGRPLFRGGAVTGAAVASGVVGCD